ncbi:MAG: hypothetical protein IKN79_07060 [Eubacterium sp.]|nr:hypothetical protein [Eubacterium sp.]
MQITIELPANPDALHPKHRDALHPKLGDALHPKLGDTLHPKLRRCFASRLPGKDVCHEVI